MKRTISLVLLVLGALANGLAAAESSSLPGGGAASVEQWLMRGHEAACQRAYVGTFVVTTGNYMSSSRIWHAGEGQQQMERVDALTGPPRSTFRHNDEVVTFLPDRRIVVQETREALGLFPNLLNRADAAVARFYRLSAVGQGRVAGLEADIVQLTPVDALRFGYQIWSEQKTGLVLKLQTLDGNGRILEQAAFSELQLDAPVTMANLKASMGNTQGYRVRTPNLVRTTVEQEGWTWSASVPGFQPLRCYKRVQGAAPAAGQLPLQCIFSDGLASVSLFVEPFDPSRHLRLVTHGQQPMGATHMRARQLGNWWLTAVGEVPPQTLTAFVQALERKK